MGKEFVKNDSKSNMFVGGMMIPPGEGRWCDVVKSADSIAKAEAKEAELSETKEETTSSDSTEPNPEFVTLLDQAVGKVVERLSVTPLPVTSLQEILELEESDKNRTGVVTPLKEAIIKRAAEIQEVLGMKADEMKEYIADLDGWDVAEMLEHEREFQQREDIIELLQARLSELAAEDEQDDQE